jgi:hypothetical protein
MSPPMRIGTWAISSSCRLGDRATLCHPRGSLCSWPVRHNEFLSGHWPALGVGRHNCGCHVDGPLNLPRTGLDVSHTVGHRAVRILSELQAIQAQACSVVSGCPVSKEEDG